MTMHSTMQINNTQTNKNNMAIKSFLLKSLGS